MKVIFLLDEAYNLLKDIIFKVGGKMDDNCFYTFNEYMKNEEDSLTPSMQDYLEMIYRLSLKTGFIRVHQLSDALNVQPPSATKMVQKFDELKLLKYEKYGILKLSKDGEALGEALLKRHNVIEKFLNIIGVSEAETLRETEKIEHTISKKTTRCFENFIEFSKDNPDIIAKYKKYLEEQNI